MSATYFSTKAGKKLCFKKKNPFLGFFLAMLDLHCCVGFSLVAVMRGGVLSSGSTGASHCGGFSCCIVWALG